MTYRRASISFQFWEAHRSNTVSRWTYQSHPLSSSFEAMSVRNNLGPARWVKNPKPNEHGKPHWESSKRLEPDKGVEAKMEVASSGSSQQAVAGGGQSAGPSASEPSTKQSTNLILPALKTALKTAPSEVITLDFQSLDTVRDVKEKMHKQVNRPPEQQRLMLADKQLEDHCTLAHYKIDSKSTLKLELPPGLAIGDVFCIVLHSLGTGDPVVSSQHATSFALLLRFSHVDRHMITHANLISLASHSETVASSAHL